MRPDCMETVPPRIPIPSICTRALIFHQLPRFQAAYGSGPTGRVGAPPGLHLIHIYRFKLLPRGRTGFFVAAGLSAIALATADVPPAALSAVAVAKAEAGGILPPGSTPRFQSGSQIIEPSAAGVRFPAGRDARLYGRQDARRYHKLRIRCSPRDCGDPAGREPQKRA